MFKNKDLAVDINKLMLEISKELDQSIAKAKAEASDEEFNTYRRSVGKIMAEIFETVLVPTYTKYPELDINDILKD